MQVGSKSSLRLHPPRPCDYSHATVQTVGLLFGRWSCTSCRRIYQRGHRRRRPEHMLPTTTKLQLTVPPSLRLNLTRHDVQTDLQRSFCEGPSSVPLLHHSCLRGLPSGRASACAARISGREIGWKAEAGSTAWSQRSGAPSTGCDPSPIFTSCGFRHQTRHTVTFTTN